MVGAQYYGLMLPDYVDRMDYVSSDPYRILIGTGIYKKDMMPLEIAEGIRDMFNQCYMDSESVEPEARKGYEAIKDADIVAAVLAEFVRPDEPFTDGYVEYPDEDSDEDSDEEWECPNIYFYLDWS